MKSKSKAEAKRPSQAGRQEQALKQALGSLLILSFLSSQQAAASQQRAKRQLAGREAAGRLEREQRGREQPARQAASQQAGSRQAKPSKQAVKPASARRTHIVCHVLGCT